LLKQFGLPAEDFHTFIYIKNNKYYLRSSAALQVLNDLGGAWKLMYVFIIIPRPVRDLFYNFIAKNRYRLFGKREACMIPTPELKKKFLA
jgi:predicted DCC family thiol-disulfide oxidoreductase YuxK